MRRPYLIRRRGALVGLVALAMAMAACGSNGSGSDSGSGSKADAAQVSAARTAISPYVGHPSSFPATEKLASRPKPGSTFTFLQCSAPVCALFAQLMPAPAKALGVKFVAVNSGSSATSSQAAASSALSSKPAAVLVGASNPQLYGDYLRKLVDAGTVVAGGGTVGGRTYGVQEAVGGEHSVFLAGRLLADWVTVQKKAKANVAFFGTPELTFSKGMQSSFAKELKQRCAACNASYQQLSITTYGTTAPGQVISYLQSHPKTDTVVFASMEAATGLAAALKNAHLSPTTLGFAPTPGILQDIAQGRLTAGLALDFNVQVWMQMNLAARLLAHQKTPVSNLEVDLQFLTKKDLAGVDVSHGWTGYPDVAQRFAKLWGQAG